MKINSESRETPICVYWPVSMSQYFYLCLCVCVSVSLLLSVSIPLCVCRWVCGQGRALLCLRKRLHSWLRVWKLLLQREREKNDSSQSVENSFSIWEKDLHVRERPKHPHEKDTGAFCFWWEKVLRVSVPCLSQTGSPSLRWRLRSLCILMVCPALLRCP